MNLCQRIKALPVIKDEHGDECVSREVVLELLTAEKQTEPVQVTALTLEKWYAEIQHYLENPSTPSGIPHDPPLLPGCTQEIWNALEYMDYKTFLRAQALVAALAPVATGQLEPLVRELILHYDEWVASDDSDFGSGNVDKAVEDLRATLAGRQR